MTLEEQLNAIKRLKAIADTGLVYSDVPYDIERYEELKDISLKLLAHLANESFSKLDSFFLPQLDYPTPKVDVRGLVINEKDEILMAQESVDNKWTIPGGWADIGNTPKEVVLKEIKEETGIDAEVVRLIAIYDKQRHKHPAEPYYIYKLMFFCRAISGELQPGFDMKGAGYFALDTLPELSEERILESQLKHLFHLVKQDIQEVYVD
ncbi:NUDIX hydrolase [Croceitalea rosinachiae]|uniref:NUDIX hydrolase n=1 Tax=Croceitalea rosinachiae TaxID=3075596 RepID=A0ABU3A998_9FLAO|nr:NUDIX hydrolase [Croceitalea sp. F388]MDT0606539.1 NUDIX hydrolase [Croceitalea sp. F388]